MNTRHASTSCMPLWSGTGASSWSLAHRLIERRFTPRMIASSETLSAWSGMLVDGGTWDIHFDSVCKKVHRDESTALKLTLRRPQVWGVPRLSHHICRCAVAVDAIGRGLRHRKAGCEAHGEDDADDKVSHFMRSMSESAPAGKEESSKNDNPEQHLPQTAFN